MSDSGNDAERAAQREDEEDLAAFAERDQEGSMSYEAFLAQLKADGTLQETRREQWEHHTS